MSTDQRSVTVSVPPNIDLQQGIAALFPEFGVVDGEFVRPGSDLLWATAVREAEQRFGHKLSSPTAGELQYVEMLVLFMYAGFEQMEANYHASTYRHARGPQLDAHLALPGFDRLPRREATGEVTFVATGARADPPDSQNWTGGNDRDRTIASGTLVATVADGSNPQIVFETADTVTLPAGQPTIKRVPIRALGPFDPRQELAEEQVGEDTNVPAGAIQTLVRSVRGVKPGGVTNPLPTGASGVRQDGSDEQYDFISGRDKEGDAPYRRRWEGSRGLNGVATVGAIEAAVRNAGDGEIVRDCRVRENFRAVDNRPEGLPSKAAVGVDVWFEEDTQPNRDAVHQALLESGRAGGVECYGDIDGTAVLHEGTEHERIYPPPDADLVDDTGDTRSWVGFSLIEEVPVYVSAELAVTSQFPSDGVAQIRNEIVEYVGGERTDGEDIAGDLRIGADALGDKIQGILSNPDVRGVREVVGEPGVDIGTAENPSGKQDVAIGNGQVARTTVGWLDITTTPAGAQ